MDRLANLRDAGGPDGALRLMEAEALVVPVQATEPTRARLTASCSATTCS